MGHKWEVKKGDAAKDTYRVCKICGVSQPRYRAICKSTGWQIWRWGPRVAMCRGNVQHENKILEVEKRMGADLRTAFLNLHDMEGLTVGECAEQMGISRCTLKRWLKWYKIPFTPHPKPPQFAIDMPHSLESRARKMGYMSLADYNATMHAAGYTRNERDKMLGCGRGGIYRVLHAQGVEPLKPIITEKQRAARKKNMAKINASKGKRGFGKFK